MSEPYGYIYENLVNASRNPSSTHVNDAFLTRYFRDRLLRRAITVLKFDGIPETWDLNFLQYVLFCQGYIAVVETDKYGVIPLNCSLGGYNVQYQPTYALIANPRLKGILRPVIHEECELIRLQPDYRGVMELVNYHAGKLALASESIDMNLWSSKLAYVFTVGNKAAAESFKKMFDKIMSGEPAVVQGKELLSDDGGPAWAAFAQNLTQNFIAPEIFDLMRSFEKDFDREIGIPFTDEKKERMITDEVLRNNAEISVQIDQWLDEVSQSLERVNAMFGTDISVSKRYGSEMASPGILGGDYDG